MDFMRESIQKSSRGWICNYKEVNFNNKTIIMKKKNFSNEDDAYFFYKEVKEKYITDLKKIKKIYGRNALTLSEYLDDWYQNVLSGYASASYLSVARWAIYHLILPSMTYDKILKEVMSSDIDLLLAHIAPLSKCAAFTAQKFLRVAFNDAIISSRLSCSPMEDAIVYHNPSPKIKLYNAEELKKFLYAARDSSIYLEILLALFMGLRKGEIRGLRFSDFDWKKQTVAIKRQAPNTTTSIADKITEENIDSFFNNPKTVTSIRTLKVPDFLWPMLEERKLLNESILLGPYVRYKCYSDFVCLTSTGNIKCKGTFDNNIKQIYLSANLQPISMHKFRHLGATLLFEAGIPLKEISRYLGHASETTTFEIYCGIFEADTDLKKFIETFDPTLHRR